ncbi:MAG: DUF503 domain-containing protein [Thermoleophilia bacterium]
MTCNATIGVLLADLHFPVSRSLKEKRAPLVSLRDVVRGRFHAAFSEVGFQDVWQRARVLIVLAASSQHNAETSLDEIDRYLHAQEYEVARVLVKTADPLDALWDFEA